MQLSLRCWHEKDCFLWRVWTWKADHRISSHSDSSIVLKISFISTNIGNGDTLWSLKVSFENFVNLCFFIIRVMRKINFQVCWQIVEFKPDALSPEPWRRIKYFPVWYFTSIPSSRATDSGDWKVDMIISLYFWTSFCQAQHRLPPKNDKLIFSFSYLPCELEAICTMNRIITSSSRNSYGVDHSSESQPAPARPTAAP